MADLGTVNNEETKNKEDANAPMRTLFRAFSVLDCFTAEAPSLSLRQVAEMINLSDATTLRLVRSLVELGYLVRDQSQQYSLSLKILHLASCVKVTLDMRDIARETMSAVVAETDETVALLMRDGDGRVVIDYAAPNNGILGVVRVGDRLPLPIGAGSKLILSYLEPHEQNEIIQRLAPTLDIDVVRLRETLREIPQRGYSLSESEKMASTIAIAAPIFQPDGSVKHALSLHGPISRVAPRKDALIAMLIRAAAEISLRNGYTPPNPVRAKNSPRPKPADKKPLATTSKATKAAHRVQAKATVAPRAKAGRPAKGF